MPYPFGRNLNISLDVLGQAENKARKLQDMLHHAYKSMKNKDDLIECLKAKVKALEIVTPHLRGDFDDDDHDVTAAGAKFWDFVTGGDELAGPRL